MPTHSATKDSVNPTLTERQLSAIKVVKYLFISSLVLLIIGAFVLFCIAINTIATNNEDIDTIERIGITEFAAKRTERLRHQKLLATFSLIINLLIILLSGLGIVAVIRDNFLLIILFGVFNTLVLCLSLWSTTGKAAIILLQIAVSLFAFSYTLSIYHQMKVEAKKKQKNGKEVKNNVKNNHIEDEHKFNHFIEDQTIVIENNNPEVESIKDLKELNGVLV